MEIDIFENSERQLERKWNIKFKNVDFFVRQIAIL
jgi:hypothetical protein